MSYPITASSPPDAPVPVGKSTSVPFRPAAAGLVTCSAVAVGLEPPPPPGSGGSPAPDGGGTDGRPGVPFTVGLRVDIFKPGSATAVATNTGQLRYQPGTTPLNRLVVAANVMAGPEDLQADWLAVATNTGSSPANQSLLVRYQVMPGDLGKVDHIVVLMMENRSFDHMLGHLSLTGGRADVDGLQGGMSNPGPAGPVPISPLDSQTFFQTDPGHGWTDVTEQLEFDVATGRSNSGFVRNFATMRVAESIRQLIDKEEADPDRGLAFSFVPTSDGTISIECVPSIVPKHSTSGLVATIVLTGPSSPGQLASVQIPWPSGVGRLSYDATGIDPAAPGEWAVQVTNRSDDKITFTTTVTYPIQLEPLNSIMGYYDGTALPMYDFLAQHYTTCDRWFASLPTDTWPNRLYALTGGSGGLDTTPSGSGVASNPPGYTLQTIFEVLQQRSVDWKIYYSDLPYALIFRRLAQDAIFTQRMRPLEELLQGAQTGDLPAVSWIDPSFLDVQEALGEDNAANDDHPPGDVTRGQHLVWQIYDALSRGPSWPKTLLLITYDEHGGFFDHVLPPGTPVQAQPAPGHLPTRSGTDEPLPPAPVQAAGTSTPVHAIPPPGLASGSDSPEQTPVAPVHIVADPVPLVQAGPTAAGPVPGPVAVHPAPVVTVSSADPAGTTAPVPANAPSDDDPRFTRYGLRVPAFIISPWAAPRTADHVIHDHTSLLATILNRFCADGRPSMGARADHATDISAALVADTPSFAPTALEPPRAAAPGAAATATLGRGSFGDLLRQVLIGF